MTPRVIVIVLNWCNGPDTAACVSSLAASDYPALTTLIVDNGSPDGSGEKLHERFPDLPYLQTGENLGYAGGNNRGMDWAIANGADYLLVINDDTIVDPACVSRLVAAAEDTGAAVVAPRIFYYDEPSLVWYGGGTFSMKRALGLHDGENREAEPSTARRDITFVCGCCFLIRASVVGEVGGFDESFFAYVEDAELSHRLSRRGYRMLYEPRATLLHRIKRVSVPSPFQLRQRDRNRRRLVRKHYSLGQRLRFAAWFYPTRVAHIARYVATGQWARARAVLQGTFSPLSAR